MTAEVRQHTHREVKWYIECSALFGVQSFPSMIPCTRCVGLSCCLSIDMLVYEITAASRAFWPSQGDKAAWALEDRCQNPIYQNEARRYQRVANEFDVDALSSKAAAQAGGERGTRGRMAPK